MQLDNNLMIGQIMLKQHENLHQHPIPTKHVVEDINEAHFNSHLISL